MNKFFVIFLCILAIVHSLQNIRAPDFEFLVTEELLQEYYYRLIWLKDNGHLYSSGTMLIMAYLHEIWQEIPSTKTLYNLDFIPKKIKNFRWNRPFKFWSVASAAFIKMEGEDLFEWTLLRFQGYIRIMFHKS